MEGKLQLCRVNCNWLQMITRMIWAYKWFWRLQLIAWIIILPKNHRRFYSILKLVHGLWFSLKFWANTWITNYNKILLQYIGTTLTQANTLGLQDIGENGERRPVLWRMSSVVSQWRTLVGPVDSHRQGNSMCRVLWRLTQNVLLRLLLYQQQQRHLVCVDPSVYSNHDYPRRENEDKCVNVYRQKMYVGQRVGRTVPCTAVRLCRVWAVEF